MNETDEDTTADTLEQVLDQLRDPAPAVQPDRHFARRLRETVAEAHSEVVAGRFGPVVERIKSLADEGRLREVADRIPAPVEPAASARREQPVVVPPIDIDSRSATVTPYLCAADGAAALDFYIDAFGARVTMRVTSPRGMLGHAEFWIGPVRFFLSEEFPDHSVVSPSRLGGSSVTLHLEVAGVDRWFMRALEAGARGVRPPKDQVHGLRTATIEDPAGHRWVLAERVLDVSVDEYAARKPDWIVRAGDGPPDTPPEPPF